MDTKLDLFTQSLITSRDSAVFVCACRNMNIYIFMYT